ncbi:O-antigen ligase family protein [Phaeovulum sp. W22_SRMD_FR3]|uniref:O-antigen ligase family protein n=1 Tax=Phaeovulum sp. W22_SRMD_FR3 TaxID=3240274 RepID=UPI003F9AF869
MNSPASPLAYADQLSAARPDTVGRAAAVITILAVLFFSGAFFEQLLIGSGAGGGISLQVRILNAAKLLPVYIAAFWWLARYRRLAAPVLHAYLLVWLFLIYFLLNGMFRPEALLNVGLWIPSLMVFVSGIGISLRMDFPRFVRLLSGTLLVVGVASLVYIYFIPSMGLMQGRGAVGDDLSNSSLYGVPQGVFIHKNKLADAMAMGVIIAIGARGIISTRYRIVLFSLSFFLLLQAGSANKLMGVVGAFAALLTWRLLIGLTRSRIGAKIMLFLLLAIFAFSIPLLIDIALTALGKDVTLTGRVYVWATAERAISLQPIFGYGPVSIWDGPLGFIPELPYFKAPHAHNVLLEVTLQSGVLGGILATAAILSLSNQVLSCVDTRSPRFTLALMVLVSMLLRSTFEFNFFSGSDFSVFIFAGLFSYLVLDTRIAPAKAAAFAPAAGQAWRRPAEFRQ